MLNFLVCSSFVILNLKEKYKKHVKKIKLLLLHFFLDFVRSSFNFKKVLFSHFFLRAWIAVTSVNTSYFRQQLRNFHLFLHPNYCYINKNNLSIIFWQNRFILSTLYRDICNLIWYSWEWELPVSLTKQQTQPLKTFSFYNTCVLR